VNVIINLKHTKLEIENLNYFMILIIKNWLDDACDGCDEPLKLKDMAKFITSKGNLIGAT
jgi:hypothetical protein